MLMEPTSSAGAVPNDLGPSSMIALLQQRLSLYEDWNERLQLQLQQLLRLPHNDLQKLSARMNNPDIAIPLLQCYDATILEREEDLQSVKTELNKVKTAHQELQARLDQVSHARRMAEQMARSATERLQEDQQASRGEVERLEKELSAVRNQAKDLLESESSFKASLEAERKKTLSLAQELESKKLDLATLEEKLGSTSKKLKSLKQEEDQERYVAESQAVQLQLIAKENDDKMQEIERLRVKMIHALKQQQDNHSTHLKIVEEKHRVSLEAIREELRTHEVQVLKLRAQLARADIGGSYAGNSGSSTALVTKSAADIMEGQTRQALELEVKRLYAELTAAQVQRDDVTYRYEQLLSSRRSDTEDRLSEARHDSDVLRKKLREMEERLEKRDAEVVSLRDQLRQAKEKSKGFQSELGTVTAERDSAVRRADESKKAQQRAESALEHARQERDEAVLSEQRAVQSSERRLDETRHDEATAREKLKRTCEDLERRVEVAQKQVGDLQVSRQLLTAQLAEKDRLVELLHTKEEKLSIALRMCKEQLVQCDQRLVAYATLEGRWKQEGRQLALQIEHLRMDHARMQRERDRFAHELAHARR